jgi:hypothetical protein
VELVFLVVSIPFIVWWLVPFLITRSLADWFERPGPDEAAQQQSAAEEGSTSSVDYNRDGQAQDNVPASRFIAQKLRRLGQSCLRVLVVALRRALSFLWTRMGRLLLGATSLYIYLVLWGWEQVTKRNPTKILLNAFGLLNFSMAVLCYLVFFDGEGTSAPAWSDMFG